MIKDSKTVVIFAIIALVVSLILIFPMIKYIWENIDDPGYKFIAYIAMVIAVGSVFLMICYIGSKANSGEAVLFEDLKDEVSFRIVKKIGDGYHLVATESCHPSNYDSAAIIVKNLPAEVDKEGGLFIKREKKLTTGTVELFKEQEV